MSDSEVQMHHLEKLTIEDLDPDDGMRLVGEPVTAITFKDVIVITGTIDELFDGEYVKQIGVLATRPEEWRPLLN